MRVHAEISWITSSEILCKCQDKKKKTENNNNNNNKKKNPSYLDSLLSGSLMSVCTYGQRREKGETWQSCLSPGLTLFTVSMTCKETTEKTGKVISL